MFLKPNGQALAYSYSLKHRIHLFGILGFVRPTYFKGMNMEKRSFNQSQDTASDSWLIFVRWKTSIVLQNPIQNSEILLPLYCFVLKWAVIKHNIVCSVHFLKWRLSQLPSAITSHSLISVTEESCDSEWRLGPAVWAVEGKWLVREHTGFNTSWNEK